MNIRSISILAVLGACAWAHAAIDKSIASGNYRLIISEEARGLAKISGEALPAGSIMFSDDHTFVLDTVISKHIMHREGHFDLSGVDVTLTFNDTDNLKGKLLDDGSIDLTGLHFARKEMGPVVGKWRVAKIDACLEMLEDKTFKFRSSGATSAGKYKVDGGVITLIWTSVDGQAVEEGTMHKKLIVDDEGTFWIDTYHYKKD
jgi:hypothetical protein